MKKIFKLLSSILFGFIATAILYFGTSCFGSCNRSFIEFITTIYLYLYVIILGLIFYGVITFLEKMRLKNSEKENQKIPRLF
jgi:hypothetical protein